MRQIRPQDALFLYLEDDEVFAHGTFAWIYEPTDDSEMSRDALLRHVASRLAVSPILHEKLQRVPLDLDYPYWVGDGSLDLERHVHQRSLPAPGGVRELWDALAEVHARPLAMDRPLWELHLVDGLAGARRRGREAFALFAKLHHVALDGAAGMALLRGLHDPEPLALREDLRAPDRGRSRDATGRPPDLVTQLAGAAWNNVRRPLGLVRVAGEILRDLPGQLGEPPARDVSRDAGVPKTCFNRKVSRERCFESRAFPLEALRAIRSSVPGATVNDVLLTLCGGGLRRFLEDRNELPGASMVAGCPIDVRLESEADAGGNRIAAMTTKLHTEIANPLERLAAVARSSRRAKRPGLVPPRRFLDLNDGLTSPALALACRAVGRLTRSNDGPVGFNCPVSNLPGSTVPLYLGGARLTNVTCAMPVMNGFGLFIGACTYAGSMNLGLTSSRNLLPDPAILGDCMERAFEDLEKAAAS